MIKLSKYWARYSCSRLRSHLWKQSLGALQFEPHRHFSKTLPTCSLSSSTSSEATFHYQSSLPRLPIPSLHSTAQLYLSSLKPLLNASDYEKSEAFMTEFIKPGGVGEKLQAKLVEYDKAQPHSWLEEFWMKYAYLIWRCPTLINVNWWGQFVDTLDLPKSFQHPYNDVQLMKAAYLISYMVQAQEMIENQRWPIDKTRKGEPFCMKQYSMIFGTTRIPEKGLDRLVNFYPCTSKHIILMIQDQMYRMEIQSNEPMHLFTQLKYIVDDFKNNHPQQPPIGVLTSENRDTWAHLRQLLMQHEKNRAHLECIESALFVASLDDTVSPATHDHFFHHHGRNRWFDKSINLVVLPDGQAGVNGEHSPCDAVVPGKIFNWVVQKVQETLSLNAVSSSTVPLNKTIKPLFWHIDSTVKKGIEEAQIHAYQLSQSVNVSLHQGEISWGWLKNMGGTPDALMQVAMQRAYHLDQNKWTATYESASIRKFKHGRTECIRSCTKEAQTWTHAMDDPKLPNEIKIQKLSAAIKSHMNYTDKASLGKGCDRHMLGLKLMLGSESHPVFSDPAYALSSTFRLSTSNMSPGTYLYGGFGPVTEDGYGVNYAFGSNRLKFSVSAWNTCPDTHALRFRNRILRVMDEINDLLKLQK